MSNVNPFNYSLDKITEREVVYDFVSRLKIGEAFDNKDVDTGANSNDKSVIFPAGYKLKDDVLMNIIRTMDISDILHLDSIKTTYKSVMPGESTVIIKVPEGGYTLYRIIQEKTGYDVTECFTEHKASSNDYYKAEFNVPFTTDDIYKAYFFKKV